MDYNLGQCDTLRLKKVQSLILLEVCDVWTLSNEPTCKKRNGGNNVFHVWANSKRTKNGLQIERHVVSDFLLPDLPFLFVQFDRNSDCQALGRIRKQQTVAMQGRKDAPRSGQKESE